MYVRRTRMSHRFLSLTAKQSESITSAHCTYRSMHIHPSIHTSVRIDIPRLMHCTYPWLAYSLRAVLLMPLEGINTHTQTRHTRTIGLITSHARALHCVPGALSNKNTTPVCSCLLCECIAIHTHTPSVREHPIQLFLIVEGKNQPRQATRQDKHTHPYTPMTNGWLTSHQPYAIQAGTQIPPMR